MSNKTSGREDIEFREVQTFPRPMWILVALSALGSCIALFFGLFVGRPQGEKDTPGLLILLVVILLGLGLPLLFFLARLMIEVREDGLYYCFFPFHFSWHRLGFSDIRTAEARSYRPLLEYGGWGIRYGFKGKAYNARGNQGVQLQLNNGRRILFGSQKAEELAAAIAKAMHTNQS